jgi:hypothetical protein
MAMHKRKGWVCPNALVTDIGVTSHWASVPPHSTALPVRGIGAMSDGLPPARSVEAVALESTGVCWIALAKRFRTHPHPVRSLD